MITIQAKKHDNFSVEFKFGFEGNQEEVGRHEFVVNSWIFVPNSLDITPQTYGKDQFYRDIKSNVRLITPVYLLRELADAGSLPFVTLRETLESLASQPSSVNTDNYESQIKLFVAIFKSALRNHSVHTTKANTVKDVVHLTEDFVTSVRRIVGEYRELYQIINVPRVEQRLRNYYLFGDEMMSHIIDVQSLRILKKIDSLAEEGLKEVRESLVGLLCDEKNYKLSQNYKIVEPDAVVGNRELVFRYGLLKK